MNLFLDTSVVVKLYHREEGTDNLWNFITRDATDLFLTISDLTAIEFHSAFLKRVRIEEIKVNTAKQTFTGFERDIKLMRVLRLTILSQQMKDFWMWLNFIFESIILSKV